MALSLSSVTTPVTNAFNSVVGTVTGGALKAKSLLVSSIWARFAVSGALVIASGASAYQAYTAAKTVYTAFSKDALIKSLFNKEMGKAAAWALASVAILALAVKVSVIA